MSFTKSAVFTLITLVKTVFVASLYFDNGYVFVFTVQSLMNLNMVAGA